ncbi:MTH1187 family thiamine-binding protein [bacterium]|nr:MTH1187 family thiamine-binding protein [bacterium]
MPVMEISVIPLGTRTPSVSDYVAVCIKKIKGKKNIKYTLTSMGTVIEADTTSRLLKIADEMHHAVLQGEIKRVVTTIKIDDRLDKKLTMKGKINTVQNKIK